MIFNCLNCGISISSKKEHCTYCKVNNSEVIQMLTGSPKFSAGREKIQWRERIKGTILALVLH